MKMRELPPDFAPMLVCEPLYAKRELRKSVLYSVACCVGLVIYAFWRGLDWQWSIGCPVLCFAWSAFIDANSTLRAGDGWFATSTRFVRTDRLVKLRARAGMPLRRLEMRDSDGRVVRARLGDLTRYPQVWQLISAGIEQSLARDLVIDNNYTAVTLGLPYTPRRKRSPRQTPTGAAKPSKLSLR